MENLKALNFQFALELLKEAEQLLATASIPQDLTESEHSRLLALTYNNLGCLYKKKMQPNVALKYLQKTLKIESKNQQDQMSIAGTLLNLCVILSLLKKHKKAIVYATNAVARIEYHLRQQQRRSYQHLHQQNDNYDRNGQFNSINHNTFQDAQDGNQTQLGDVLTRNTYTTLVISLYNLGVEHEHLNEYSQSLDAFNKAMLHTRQQLGSDPALYKMIKEGIDSVSLKQQSKFFTNFTPTNGIGSGRSSNPGMIPMADTLIQANRDYSQGKDNNMVVKSLNPNQLPPRSTSINQQSTQNQIRSTNYQNKINSMANYSNYQNQQLQLESGLGQNNDTKQYKNSSRQQNNKMLLSNINPYSSEYSEQDSSASEFRRRSNNEHHNHSVRHAETISHTFYNPKITNKQKLQSYQQHEGRQLSEDRDQRNRSMLDEVRPHQKLLQSSIHYTEGTQRKADLQSPKRGINNASSRNKYMSSHRLNQTSQTATQFNKINNVSLPNISNKESQRQTSVSNSGYSQVNLVQKDYLQENKFKRQNKKFIDASIIKQDPYILAASSGAKCVPLNQRIKIMQISEHLNKMSIKVLQPPNLQQTGNFQTIINANKEDTNQDQSKKIMLKNSNLLAQQTNQENLIKDGNLQQNQQNQHLILNQQNPKSTYEMVEKQKNSGILSGHQTSVSFGEIHKQDQRASQVSMAQIDTCIPSGLESNPKAKIRNQKTYDQQSVEQYGQLNSNQALQYQVYNSINQDHRYNTEDELSKNGQNISANNNLIDKQLKTNRKMTELESNIMGGGYENDDSMTISVSDCGQIDIREGYNNNQLMRQKTQQTQQTYIVNPKANGQSIEHEALTHQASLVASSQGTYIKRSNAQKSYNF